MAEYEKIHVCDEVIENESSGDRGLDVSVSVDTLGKVIIEFGSSMTIRTDWSGAQALAVLMEDAIWTLDEMEEQTSVLEESSEGNLLNDPAGW